MNTPSLYPNLYNASAGISLHGSVLLYLLGVTLLLIGLGVIIRNYERQLSGASERE